MARRTRKQMEGKKYEDKLIDKLNIEFGLKKPNKENKSCNKNNNMKGKGDK